MFEHQNPVGRYIKKYMLRPVVRCHGGCIGTEMR